MSTIVVVVYETTAAVQIQFLMYSSRHRLTARRRKLDVAAQTHTEQLQKLIPLLAGSTTAEAIWLLADFRVPEAGWRRWRANVILAMLYAFFKLTTSLSASWLTPPDNFLTKAGFKLVDRRQMNFGFAHADLWSRGG